MSALTEGITVVIPSHPARVRNGMLARAYASVRAQTLAPRNTIVVNDIDREGSAVTRTRGLAMVDTEWVAFLDSDDEMERDNLQSLAETASHTGADLVYPWYTKLGAVDIWKHRFCQPFDADELRRYNYIAITVLARTEAVQAAGGFRAQPDLCTDGQSACDEWGTWTRMVDLGARIVHLPQRTWRWHCHGGNTQGLTTRGDARVGE